MADKTKILLIDDDPDFVAGTKVVLEEAGYQVTTALRGADGLVKARADTPDLIVLDVIMPEMDGFSVCQELKSDPKLARVPVMMLTGFADKVAETTISVAQGFSLEAEDYVDKPVRPTELLRRIQKLLRR
jgi:two-component system alkaline phosphatase synthesis response regulator PhoP